MNMRHSWITALAAAPLLALTLLPAGAAPATAIVPASGKVTCPVASGTGGVNPALTHAGGGGGSIKINFHGKLASNCTSAIINPQGDKVIGGTFAGGGYYTHTNANSCANFDGPDVVGLIQVTITWKTTSTPIAPTTIVYKNNLNTNSTPLVLMTLNAPPGTATKTGSFHALGTPVLTQLQTNIPGTCPPSTPPIATFVIVGGKVSV